MFHENASHGGIYEEDGASLGAHSPSEVRSPKGDIKKGLGSQGAESRRVVSIQPGAELGGLETSLDENLPRAYFKYYVIDRADKKTLREVASPGQEAIPLTSSELRYLRMLHPRMFATPTQEQFEQLGFSPEAHERILRIDLGMQIFEISRKLDFGPIAQGNLAEATDIVSGLGRVEDRLVEERFIEEVDATVNELALVEQRLADAGFIDGVRTRPEVEDPWGKVQWCREKIGRLASLMAPEAIRLEPLTQYKRARLENRLHGVFGDRLEAAILYGSGMEKGVDSPDTEDLDLVVVVEDTNPDYLQQVSENIAVDRASGEKKMTCIIMDKDTYKERIGIDPLSEVYRVKGAQVYGENIVQIPVYKDEVTRVAVKAADNILESRNLIPASHQQESLDEHLRGLNRLEKAPVRIMTGMMQLSEGKLLTTSQAFALQERIMDEKIREWQERATREVDAEGVIKNRISEIEARYTALAMTEPRLDIVSESRRRPRREGFLPRTDADVRSRVLVNNAAVWEVVSSMMDVLDEEATHRDLFGIELERPAAEFVSLSQLSKEDQDRLLQELYGDKYAASSEDAAMSLLGGGRISYEDFRGEMIEDYPEVIISRDYNGEVSGYVAFSVPIKTKWGNIQKVGPRGRRPSKYGVDTTFALCAGYKEMLSRNASNAVIIGKHSRFQPVRDPLLRPLGFRHWLEYSEFPGGHRISRTTMENILGEFGVEIQGDIEDNYGIAVYEHAGLDPAFYEEGFIEL